jgi:SAM-dependent methyltransferase
VRAIFSAPDLSVRYYDRLYAVRLPASPVSGDLAFYLRQARRTGGPVLELGAGTGRIAIPLAAAGHDVTGVDSSAPALRVARLKAMVAPHRGTLAFVRADMTRFALRRRFRLALIPFRAFQHLLTPAAQRACLTRVRRHLARGGRLIVDVFDPLLDRMAPEATGPARPTVVPLEDGRRLEVATVRVRNDPLRQRFREAWTFTLRGPGRRVIERSRVAVDLRWTYRWEMRYLLEACGFRVRACHGDFHGGPPRYGREQVWVADRA